MSKETPIFNPNPDNRPVLITGANGSMGGYYVRRLAETVPVRAMARSDRDVETLSRIPNVEGIKGDVTDIESLKRATESVSVIIHPAANLSLTDFATNQRVNIDGTENLVRAAEENGIDHFHLISSVAVYGGRQTQEYITENAPLNGSNAYGYSKKKQEEIVFDSRNQFDATAIRPANVIGAGIDVWTHAMLNVLNGVELNDSFVFYDKVPEFLKKVQRRIGLKRFNLPLSLLSVGMSHAVFAYVDIENAMDLSIDAIQTPKAHGQAFNAVDGNTTWALMLNAYAHAVLDKKSYDPPSWITDPTLKGVEWMLKTAQKRGGEWAQQASDYLLHGQKYSHKKATEVLGYEPKITLWNSVSQTRDYVKEHGLIRSRQIYK